MALVNMRDMLYHAYRNNYAVGAFDLVSLEYLEGIMMAAERCRSPVILSLAESHFDYFDFDLIMPAVEAAARRAPVPVAIHLDHGSGLKSAIRAINLGCNSVMADAAGKSSADNLHSASAVVETAHACGIPVEGDPDHPPDVKGELSCTTVEEAWHYVEQTGVDFLAVSIGGMRDRAAGQSELNYQRLEQINESLNIPLVIHNGAGLSDDQYQPLIAGGVSKINYYTALAVATDAQTQTRARNRRNGSQTIALESVKESISDAVERCMRLWGSNDRAAELLARCAPWSPVEHLIIYNVTGVASQKVEAMMAVGRRVLAEIPGVREVVTGSAVKQDAKYQYTWLVRFCHPAVIDSYREHPAHVAFADNLFRPVAGERLSIDYQTIKSAYA